jgi:catechol 2,3-dioxygenase-like lactoylglutathione lyase family enzyme
MEQRVSVITLGVSDLAASRAFYERLGWTCSKRMADEVVLFQLGSIVLSLFPREALAREAHLSSEGSGFCGVALAYNTRSTAEVQGVMEEARSAGARISSRLRRTPPGAATLDTFQTRMAISGRWPGIQGSSLPMTGASRFLSSPPKPEIGCGLHGHREPRPKRRRESWSVFGGIRHAARLLWPLLCSPRGFKRRSQPLMASRCGWSRAKSCRDIARKRRLRPLSRVSL